MDIFVKSFNRPYYLDRCLKSIYKYVTGDFTIKILDDGTPPSYLARIQAQHPNVLIAHSPRYQAKVKAIQRHLASEVTFNERAIPFDFWVEQVRNGSELFLLIEDDIWLTSPIDLLAFAQQMNAHHIDMVKISWLGNDKIISGPRIPLPSSNAPLEEVKPAVPLLSQMVFLNRFRMRSILYRTGLLRFFNTGIKHQLPVYTLYAVASAFFRKSYWLNLFPAGQHTADEPAQLIRAWQWWQRTGCCFAKSQQELTRTSFITSATNSFEGIALDPFVLNYILNEAWLKGELDTMQNFPQDFTAEYIQRPLTVADDSRATYGEWLKWTDRFKNQYRNMGCVVD